MTQAAVKIRSQWLYDTTEFNAVFERPDGAIGVGWTHDTKEAAIDDLAQRDKNLKETDTRQWIRTTVTTFEQVRPAKNKHETGE